MRSYSVAVASLAVGAPRKWTDNAISQHRIEGVVSERRGVARRITFPALLTLAVAHELVNSLQLSLANALKIAGDCTRASDENDIRLGNITLRIDIQAVRRDLHQKLGDALESAPSPARGRPRQAARE